MLKSQAVPLKLGISCFPLRRVKGPSANPRPTEFPPPKLMRLTGLPTNPSPTPVWTFVMHTSLDAFRFLTPQPPCSRQQQQTPSSSLTGSPLCLFCFICFGHCRKIVFTTETSMGGKRRKKKKSQHSKIHKTLKVKPSCFTTDYCYRCVKWLQTFSLFLPTVAWSLISQLFHWTQYSSVWIISSETFVLNTPFTMWASVVFQSETN